MPRTKNPQLHDKNNPLLHLMILQIFQAVPNKSIVHPVQVYNGEIWHFLSKTYQTLRD